jgi:hypothetical protein
MIRLPAGLQFQRCPRVVAYALLAAVVTTLLLAADGAYRWYSDSSPTMAEESAAPERSVQRPEAEPTVQQANTPVPIPAREVVGAAHQTEDRPDAVTVPNPISGSIPIPAAAPVRGTARPSVQNEAVPQRAQPKTPRQPKLQDGRRPSAKQAARESATPSRPVQAAEKPQAEAAQPNVYYERDSQLGFASQLRKRTCNPATGQMPMQCYYPREGRERFPAKPLD